MIDSLKPSYKQLANTHFSYVSALDGSITINPSSCGDDQSTILPSSKEAPVDNHFFPICKLFDDSKTSQVDTSNSETVNKNSLCDHVTANSSDVSINRANTNSTGSQRNPSSLSNYDLDKDSDLSIRITSAPQHPQQRCVTSSTSAIMIAGDLTTQRLRSIISTHVSEPPIIDDHQQIEPSLSDQQFNESVINSQPLYEPHEPIKNDHQSNEATSHGKYLNMVICEQFNKKMIDLQFNEPSTNDQQLCTNINRCNTNESRIDRGANSFAGTELTPKSRAFSPDYYALTFRSEGSGLSDVVSLRGASGLAEAIEQRCSDDQPVEQQNSQKSHKHDASGSQRQRSSPVLYSCDSSKQQSSPRGQDFLHDRGASMLGETISEEVYREAPKCLLNAAPEDARSESPLMSGQYSDNVTTSEERAKIPITKARSKSCIQRQYFINNIAEEHSKKESEYSSEFLQFRYRKSPPETTKSCSMGRTAETKEERSSGKVSTRNEPSEIFSDNTAGEITTHSERSPQKTENFLHCEDQWLDRSTKRASNTIVGVAINKQSNTIRREAKSYQQSNKIKTCTNNYKSEKSTTRKSFEIDSHTDKKHLIDISTKQKGSQDQPTATVETSARSDAPLITNQSDKPHDRSNPSKTFAKRVNIPYTSERGASLLGHRGDDDSIDSGSDGLWDSVSLSFAYDSPSDNDTVANFEVKDNRQHYK